MAGCGEKFKCGTPAAEACGTGNFAMDQNVTGGLSVKLPLGAILGNR
jgi:hypothetical protein